MIAKEKQNAKINQMLNDVQKIKQERELAKKMEHERHILKGETAFPYTHGEYIELRQQRLREERYCEFLEHQEEKKRHEASKMSSKILNDQKPEVSVVPEGAMMDTFHVEKLGARAPTEQGITKPPAQKHDDTR